MRRRLWTALVLGLAAADARAEELTPAERTWAKTCVESLASPSARVRESAGRALARFGVDAVPVVLLHAGRLQADEHWAALSSALAEVPGAADALAARSGAWPKASAARLEALVSRLRASAPKSHDGGDPDVTTKVNDILDSFAGRNRYSSDEPDVRKIAALGRPAIPVLLDALRSSDSFGAGFRTEAAADALALLVREEDIPALREVLEGGRLVVAKAFKRLQGEAALDALLAPVAKGFLDYPLLEALERFRREERVRQAILEWLRQQGASGAHAVGHTAEFLAEMREMRAGPVLAPLLDLRFDAAVAVRVAKAAAMLGVKAGIPALIAVMEDDGGHGWETHEAGDALNAVVGEAIYVGSFTSARPQGNTREAAKKFRAWWEASKDRLRFDETRWAWRLE